MNEPLPLVIANHKANKTWDQLTKWIDEVGKVASAFLGTIIVAPSSPFLNSTVAQIKSKSYKLKVSSQDVSKFEQGPHTGEFAASQIADICQFAIIGHSERREHFDENDEALSNKVESSRHVQIEPIFCVQNEDTHIPATVKIVAYEPIFAIGTGTPDSPENAKRVAANIKPKGNYTVLYGGSVDDQNAKTFMQKNIIDGLLIGTKSLDASEFIAILKALS